MRLRTKFILVSLVGGLASVAIIGVVAYTKAKESIKQVVGASCQSNAHETAKLVNRVLHSTQIAVEQLSQTQVMEDILDGDVNGVMQASLMHFVRVNKSYVRITAVNRDGEIVASSELVDTSNLLTTRALVKRVLNGHPYFDDAHFDEPSQTWVATIAYPITAHYNVRQVIGVLCAQWRIEELSELLKVEPGTEAAELSAQVLILRRDGLLIGGSHIPQSSLFHRNLRSEGVASAIFASKHRRGYLQERTRDGRQVLVGYDFLDKQEDFPAVEWITLVRHDAAIVFAPIQRLWDWVVVIAVLVTFGVLMLSMLVSQRLSAPIVEMVAVAERVARGDFDGRVQRRSSDEVGALAGTLNLMIHDLKTQRARLLEMNEELSRSNEQLKTARGTLIHAYKMETVGRLAAGVAHEVKNPLAVISMGLDYLSTGLSEHSDANLPIVLNEMRESAGRADTIIRGLLDYSASDRCDLSEENLNSAVERSLRLVRHDLVKNRIAVTQDLCENLPPVKLNLAKMEQVFINLFINAMHAMPGGGTLSIRTFVQSSPAGSEGGSDVSDHVVAEVADSGTGIPQEVLPKIFEPFFTTKAVGIGTGLGLCVVKNIIELHGGTIAMANRPEGGAKATITFKAERTVTV